MSVMPLVVIACCFGTYGAQLKSSKLKAARFNQSESH